MLLYGLLGLLALVEAVRVLVEAARAMALRFLDMPMRFIMSFSMAGMRIERSLRSFLLAVVFCVERGACRKGESRCSSSGNKDVPLDASQFVLWEQVGQWLAVGGGDPSER
jgi:hypothetical protein